MRYRAALGVCISTKAIPGSERLSTALLASPALISACASRGRLGARRNTCSAWVTPVRPHGQQQAASELVQEVRNWRAGDLVGCLQPPSVAQPRGRLKAIRQRSRHGARDECVLRDSCPLAHRRRRVAEEVIVGDIAPDSGPGAGGLAACGTSGAVTRSTRTSRRSVRPRSTRGVAAAHRARPDSG